MKNLTLKQLQKLKEEWYLESHKECREFIFACEELGSQALARLGYHLDIGKFKLVASDPALSIRKGGSLVVSTRGRLFVPGDWVEELRGLIAELRARREEQQRQELLKQLNPFGLEGVE